MPTSNVDEVVTWLENFVDGFNFLLPGADQNLGRDLAHIVAGRISERGVQASHGKDSAKWKGERGYPRFFGARKPIEPPLAAPSRPVNFG